MVIRWAVLTTDAHNKHELFLAGFKYRLEHYLNPLFKTRGAAREFKKDFLHNNKYIKIKKVEVK